MKESITLDKKSIKFLREKSIRWDELVKDCVAFANAIGGNIIIGIEDNDSAPPIEQLIENKWVEEISKKISSRTINVSIIPSIVEAANGSEYINILVQRNIQSIASTTDGKYYRREADVSKPVPPDEMARLAADKNAFVWEIQTSKKISKNQFDESKRERLLSDLRLSDRVSNFVKEKADDELLEYYFLQRDSYLTNLGILWIGTRSDRATLLYAPSIQAIRYDEMESKGWKLLLDDYSLNPKELLERVLNDIPDWQETVEISDGMFRKNIAIFPMEVIREIVVNALVHRVYTTQGDIFINIYTDRLEIHSPGRLPLGVTPSNILNESIRRNEHLSKLFYDLGLMEKEGSGYDLIYAQLLGVGKPIPKVDEPSDRVVVTIQKQYVSKEIVRLMDKANSEYTLKQKEIIFLGLLAQHGSYSAVEISKVLNQNESRGLESWVGKLLSLKLILKTGKNKGTYYSINPEFIRRVHFPAKTNLKNIEDHRLEELIYKDINSYPKSSVSEIHKRIGEEINLYRVKRMLKAMVENDKLVTQGLRKYVRYSIKQNTGKNI